MEFIFGLRGILGFGDTYGSPRAAAAARRWMSLMLGRPLFFLGGSKISNGDTWGETNLSPPSDCSRFAGRGWIARAVGFGRSSGGRARFREAGGPGCGWIDV
jgi:hypothetical protein